MSEILDEIDQVTADMRQRLTALLDERRPDFDKLPPEAVPQRAAYGMLQDSFIVTLEVLALVRLRVEAKVVGLEAELKSFRDEKAQQEADAAARRARMEALLAQFPEPEPLTPEQEQAGLELLTGMFGPCEHCGRTTMCTSADCTCCNGCIAWRQAAGDVLTISRMPGSNPLKDLQNIYDATDPRLWIRYAVRNRLEKLGLKVEILDLPDVASGEYQGKSFHVRADGIRLFVRINDEPETPYDYPEPGIDALVEAFGGSV